MSLPKGPFNLVTCNTAPERAKRLVGQFIDAVKDRYTVIHAANCETIDEVGPTVERIKPEILLCASMWSPEESAKILAIGREKVPGIKTHAIPQGLQVKEGPDAVVKYLIRELPPLLES